MKTYCLSCKQNTDNYYKGKKTLTNSVLIQKSLCKKCFNEQSTFLKQKYGKKGNKLL